MITSLAGAGIALLSVALVMAVIPNVRHIILHGETAINESQRRKLDYDKKTEAQNLLLKTNSARLATNQEALESAARENAKQNAITASLRAEYANLSKSNARLVANNMEQQRQSAALERNIAAQKHELAIAKRAIANNAIINRDLGADNTKLYRENDNLTRERTSLLASRDKLTASIAKLTEENGKLTSDNTFQKLQYTTANNAYNRLIDDTKKLIEENAELGGKNAGLKVVSDNLTQQLQDLRFQLAGLSQDFVREYINLRQTKFNLRAGTELGRRALDAHLSPKATREELIALLKEASDKARRYGAAEGDNGRTVVIVSKRVVTPASIQMADENASLNGLVDSIAGSNTPVLVVARAINNSSANEQVIVELTPFAAVPAFHPEEVVATRTIDARQNTEGIVLSVIQFLREDMRTAATKGHLIPHVSPDTGEEEIGMLDTPEMITLVDRVRKMGGMVQLTAVANETITSADLFTFGQTKGGPKPHNLRFDLKRAPSRAPSPKTVVADG